MPETIYVGNLPFSSTADDVWELFERYGLVLDVSLVTDRDTGQSRGFGFVEMEDRAADKAIRALGSSFSMSDLEVRRARPRDSSGGGRGDRRRR
ncbi:MAG: RNA-binding protein [Chloroflexota bacterium]